jgi:hypothetical protein
VSNHRSTIWTIEAGTPGRYQGRCICGERSEECAHHWQAGDWVRQHDTWVDKIRADRRGVPSLADQRDHYRRMENAATDPALRAQWKILADGVDHRLGNVPHSDDSPLW